MRTHPEQIGKFEAKADEGIFIGYPTNKAYKIFNLRTRVVSEFINVTFDDKKIAGLDEDSHKTLTFRNDADPDTVAYQDPDEFFTDEVDTDKQHYC